MGCQYNEAEFFVSCCPGLFTLFHDTCSDVLGHENGRLENLFGVQDRREVGRQSAKPRRKERNREKKRQYSESMERPL